MPTWYEEQYLKKTGRPLPGTVKGRPRKEDTLTPEEYAELGIPWSCTPEYKREKARRAAAKQKALLEEKAAQIALKVEQKRALNMLPSQQTHVKPLHTPTKVDYDPILRPDGVPWKHPLTEELAAEKAINDALPPEEKDKNISWALLGLLAERGAWKNGTHRDQQTG